MDRWRFDWRYAAAGLGWGVGVGILTGLLAGLAFAVGQAFSAGAGIFNTVMFLILLPLYGALVGALVGGPVGLAAGLLTALAVGGTMDRGRARRTAFWTTLVTGLAAAPLVVAAADRSMPQVGDLLPAMAVLGLPVLLGAYLVARTTRAVIGAAEGRIRDYGVVTG